MSHVFTVAPSQFEIDHAAAIVAGMHYQAEHGVLPPTPMWRALERRHDLDPARFDRWHPNVGLMIERSEAAALRSDATACTPGVALQPLTVASVPEPSSLAMCSLAIVFAFVGMWGWRPETPAQTEERHRRECEDYRDNDPLL